MSPQLEPALGPSPLPSRAAVEDLEPPRCLQHHSTPVPMLSPPELAQLPSGSLTEHTALCMHAAPSTTGACLGWVGGAAALPIRACRTSGGFVPHSHTGIPCPGLSWVGGCQGELSPGWDGGREWLEKGNSYCSASSGRAVPSGLICCSRRPGALELHSQEGPWGRASILR